VYAYVEQYIIHSPAIAEDIGNVTSILPQPGSRSRIYSWLDYAADLFLEIRGSRGTGILNLKLSGNNYRELEDATAIWEFAGKPLPLGGDGGPDVDRIRLEALHTHEQLVQAAFRDQDCPRTLGLIHEPAMLTRENKSYDLDHKQAALIRAICAETEGDTRKAAVAYAQYSFFMTPPPFREKPEDMAKLREAERYLDKAFHLYPDYPHRRSWELRKEALRIQQQRTERPDDQALCLKLKETLAASRVHYVNACR
jgi:hypothetical protein